MRRRTVSSSVLCITRRAVTPNRSTARMSARFLLSGSRAGLSLLWVSSASAGCCHNLPSTHSSTLSTNQCGASCESDSSSSGRGGGGPARNTLLQVSSSQAALAGLAAPPITAQHTHLLGDHRLHVKYYSDSLFNQPRPLQCE